MKTKLLILLFLASLSTYSQYTAIPDVNFEKKLIALNIDSGEPDGQVLTSSINQLTKLDVYNSSITDLTGIQDFTALVTLYCNYNQLTTLDLSNNLLLNQLDCSHNQLISLDILKNTSLLYLSCQDNQFTNLDTSNNNLLSVLGIDRNQIATIDLSKNTNLTSLSCQKNNMTSLDLSKNIKLKDLDCNFNLLTSLDISANIALTSLHCYQNIINSLDVSSNTFLTYLECSSNNLTTLNVSNNLSLTYLGFSSNKIETFDVSKNTALRELDFSATKVTHFDITANTYLTKLGCGLNNLNNIDISKNTNLTELDCQYSKLVSLDISNNTSLTKINCSSNLLTNLDVSKNIALGSLACNTNLLTSLNVSKNHSLTSLTCSSNEIKSLDLTQSSILNTLQCNSNKLLNLNLKNNNNTLLKAASLNFKSNPNLTCIQVDDASYSDSNWSSSKDITANYNSDCNLYTAIPDAKFEQKLIALGIDTDGENGLVSNANIATLTSLDVSNSNITDLTGIEGFIGLTTLNCSSNNLKSLNLSKNLVLNSLNSSNNTELTCIQVADVAKANTDWTTTKDAITSFNLDCEIYTLIPDSKFEDKLIALGLDTDGKNGKIATKNIATLTSLDVSNSSITDLTGIQDFLALKTLYCSLNPITALDLSKNVALTYLGCTGNSGSQSGGGNGKLTSLDLSKNIKLKTLNCSYNQIEALDISQCTELTYLNCSINYISSLAIVSDKLTQITCNGNRIKALDVSKNINLTSLYCDYNKLTTLDLSKNTNLNYLICEKNNLINLNLKNGNNTNLVYTYSLLKNNPDLTCIQVDDVAYSDTNWSGIKDLTASYSETCTYNEIYTQIPDANFEDKLIALGIDKDGKNGKVATNSINTITNLNISNSGIQNLTGIEDFAALKTLECNNNQLTTLDLLQNSYLTELNCSTNQLNYLFIYKNRLLSKLNCSENQLITLSLIGNTLLSELNCSYNKIVNLDITKNTNLTLLYSSFNKLANLDVSNNKLLKELECSDNNIYNLNIKNGNNANMQRMIFGNFSNNPNLNCIQVDNAVFSNDNWIAKDATASYAETCGQNIKETLIPDSKFEDKLIALGIDTDGKNGKVLTSSIATLSLLNVSSSSITDLTGIQDFISLSTLICRNNQLKTLDVSNNKLITRLGCETNQLTSLDVSKNLMLKELTCDENNLTSLDLSTNLALTKIYCTYNKLTSLNLKNGKNTLLLTGNIALYKNPSLNCILVDDAAYANTNWSAQKDATATYNTDCNPSTLIPDSNFEDKLIALGIDTDGKNGKVITANIASITTLEVYSSSISDLTGIEDFISLTTLDCSDNNLTALNVTKNTALTYLDCSLNSIAALDVSKDTGLTELYCNTNQLAVLDVQSNVALSKLNCSDNKITSLDLSKNTVLTAIKCFKNNLTSLDLKNGNNTNLLSMYFGNLAQNPNLNCIQVDNATFCNANWEAKDATAGYSTDCAALGNTYTTIPDSNFEDKLIALGIDKDGKNGKVLTSSIFNIGTLDVSNSTITDLTGIEDFKMLTSLTCGNNAITALDISKNQSLDKLYCSVNNIRTLDVSSNTALTILSCSFNMLTTLNVSANTALKQLECSNNNLTYLNIQNGNNTNMQSMFFGNFTTNPKLTCILVDDADYSANNWGSAKDAIASYNTVCLAYTLIPDSNFEDKLISIGIDTDGKNGKVLTSSINTQIDLDVRGSEISDLTGIEDFAALRILVCSDNALTNLDVTKNTALITLFCEKNQLSSLNVSQNTNLTDLICHTNQLTSLDVSKNLKMTYLSCGKNQLTNLDVSKNNKLTSLYCSETSMVKLNLKNGNNMNITAFIATNNPNLSCIQVDDADYADSFAAPFYKDGGAIYSTDCSSLGIEDSVFGKVSIYPNPTKGELHIDNIVLEKATVYDTLGKLVKTATFTSGANTNTIHLEGAPTGIYYIYLESEGTNTAKKIIVE